jgi:hypothetical protein
MTSPFLIFHEFVSPLMCEELLEHIDFNVPDVDVQGRTVKTVKTSELAQTIIWQRLMDHMPDIEKHFEIQYKGTERIKFEWLTEGASSAPYAENSEFLRGKWLRCKSRDLTGVLFLSDYQDNLPFDSDYEVYGGKLEFPQHKFGFNPKRGSLVIFPSDPHFINATTPIQAGDLYQARLQIVATQPLIYDPVKFPGNYLTWFSSAN